jgi:fucose permease
MKTKTFPILLTFFAMGVADAMGPMSAAVQENFHITNVMATLLSFFVFIAFAAFSIPGGLLAGRIGMKKLLLLGLGLNALAMIVPCVIAPSFVVLLVCIFVLGIGTTFLQVAGNPIMRDVSAEGKFGANLSFAQGFKGIGSTVSTFLVTGITSLVIFQRMEWFQSLGWRGAFPIFFVLMVVTFILVSLLKIEESTPEMPPSVASSLSLLKKPVFALAVLGIFLYVGAEVCMARFLTPMVEAMGIEAAKAAKIGATLFFLVLTIGRLAGGAVARVMCPRMFFRVSALLGLIGGVMLMFGNATLAVSGVILAGLGFANIWPMLFSITVEEDPARGGELSGLMCMAISGGAIVPLVMSKMVDMGMGTKSFLVPIVCFAYLLVISMKGGNAEKATA